MLPEIALYKLSRPNPVFFAMTLIPLAFATCLNAYMKSAVFRVKKHGKFISFLFLIYLLNQFIENEREPVVFPISNN